MVLAEMRERDREGVREREWGEGRSERERKVERDEEGER